MNWEKNKAALDSLLAAGKNSELRGALMMLNVVDIAEYMTTLETDKMLRLYRLLPKDISADVFAYMDDEQRRKLIESIGDKEVGALVDDMFVDDAVDFLEEMPAGLVRRVLANVSEDQRKVINRILSYPDNSAGSIMTTEYCEFHEGITAREAMKELKRTGIDKETIYTLYVLDAQRKLIGILPLRKLILAEPDTLIEQLMDPSFVCVGTLDDQEAVAEVVRKYDLTSVPVVDKEGRLVGIVTVDDVIDVMEAEATEDFEIMAAMTPSDKPYSRTSAWDMWKRRVPWLMFLMLSATFTSMIINSFEDALAVQAVLIGFIPMLMGTGGNSGAQASTAVIRSISLGDTEPEDVGRVIWKEFRVAILCGVTLAAVNFVKMLLVDRMLLNNDGVTLTVAAVVSLAIVFIVMFAKVVGSVLPIAAEKLGVDPAVMANPLISTITDAVSLLIYFEIAKLMISF